MKVHMSLPGEAGLVAENCPIGTYAAKAAAES